MHLRCDARRLDVATVGQHRERGVRLGPVVALVSQHGGIETLCHRRLGRRRDRLRLDVIGPCQQAQAKGHRHQRLAEPARIEGTSALDAAVALRVAAAHQQSATEGCKGMRCSDFGHRCFLLVIDGFPGIKTAVEGLKTCPQIGLLGVRRESTHNADMT